ncbi:MAG TPA: hypothetical protein VIC05_10960 [Solirubrobacteraceae bacterium]
MDLSPESIEAIARRVVELLEEQRLAPGGLLSVSQLAKHLKLNRSWVYEHATDLGAIRLGDGPKARLRFDLQTATEALQHHQAQQNTASPSTSKAKQRRPGILGLYGDDVPLLEIRPRYSYVKGMPRAPESRVQKGRAGKQR